MGMSVVKVAAGGLPVTLATSGGFPCTEATNGFGIAVTQSTTGGGLAVTGITFGATIALSASSVLETAAVNTTVGTLSVTPGTTGSPVFTLVDSAGGKFNILGTALRTNAALDYETAASHNIIVAVSGVTPVVANRTITISVTDVAEPVIALTGTTVNEDAAVNTTVGTLSVVNTFTGTPVYTLTDSAGGKFNISGNLLRVNAALDYETATTHNITARVTGITPAAADKVFTVLVLDITESGGAYQGPGDIKAGALGWWGLRAYSAAQCTGTVKAIQVVKASDGTAPTDINIKTDGSLDVAAISALGYAVKVSKLYDQSGNGRDLAALTTLGDPELLATPPILNLTGIGGTKPCIEFSAATQSLRNLAGFGAVAQPWTISMIFNRTTNNSAYESYLGPTATFGLYGNNAANGVLMYVGSSLAVATAADGAVHTGQFVFNNTTGFAYIDGVNTAMDVGATTGWSAGMIHFGNNQAQSAVLSQRTEVGFWGLAFSPAEAAAMNTNQQNYLSGTGGGGAGVTKNIVTDYGAVGDAQWAQTTLSITTNVLTSATPIWAIGDVGKSIVVGQCGGGAGEPQGGTPLRTTIAGFTDATRITLAANCVSALSSEPNVIVAWGTNNGKMLPPNGGDEVDGPFARFRNDYQGQTVTLTIPAGTYLISQGNFGGLFNGIRNITVNATGATLAGGLFQIQADAQYGLTGHTARTASVTAGSSFVTLSTPSQVSRFVVGNYAMMAGFGLQYGGYPTNHQRFEYLLIAAIDSDSGSPTYGRITFSTPLVNAYLSTWPLYDAGGPDYGGPATLYAMDPDFNHTCVVNNLTVAHHCQWAVAGLSITLNNCVFKGLYGPYPTMGRSIVFTNCSGLECHMEVDKLVTAFTMTGCTWGGIGCQSTSTTLFTLDNTDITYTLLGTPYKTVIRNGCAIGTLQPGSNYGFANELDVRDSVVTNFGSATYHGSGYEVRSGDFSGDGIQSDFTMASGIITIPSSFYGFGIIQQWAVTGGKMYFVDMNVGTIGSFSITDVTQDASNVYVHTTWSGGFPSRSYPAGLGLHMLTHAAPVCTFVNVTGCPEVVDLSGAPVGTPLYSWYKRTHTGYVADGPYWQLYGRVKYIRVNVTTPYVGATGTSTCTLDMGNALIKLSDRSNAVWAEPVINLKTAGARVFDATAGSYPVNWTGGVAGDALTNMSEALWSASNFRVQMSAIAAGTGPVFTVEVITDQGLSVPVLTTFATFDGTPVNGVVVSNGGRTATHTSATNNAGVNSTVFLSSGKYYFEHTIVTSFSNGLVSVGLFSSGGVFTFSGIGFSSTVGTASCLIYTGNGSGGTNTGLSLGTAAIGDVFCVAVNLDTRLGWIRRNAGNWNATAGANPATGTGGVTLAAGSFAPGVRMSGTIGQTDAVTVNCGQTVFGFAVPSGFASGWGT